MPRPAAVPLRSNLVTGRSAQLRGRRAAYDNVLETGGVRPHLHPRLG